MDRLKEYNNKRDFEKTKEPKGKAKAGENSAGKYTSKDSKARLRFVVQHHIASRDHYDFRLEWQGTLLSWAVPKGPSYNLGDRRLAIQVEDHPLEYRNFEGTIPKGEYGGGTVMLWDEGFWEPQIDFAIFQKEPLKFILYGDRLKGKWALIPLKDEARENHWLLLKEKDEYAKSSDGISEFTTSTRTGRTMAEIGEIRTY